MKALMASYRRPGEILNYIRMHSALTADRLRSRASVYPSVDWFTALAQLDGIYPGSARFLLEPKLKQLESYARAKADALRDDEALPAAFNSDLTLARCLYLICRALMPNVVVETGVAYGMSSAFILQALAVNGLGVLHSIDLPLPSARMPKVTGILVPNSLRSRWHLHLGSSQHELPKLVRSQVIDVFVHDSLHTFKNMKREFHVAWPRIRPGGVLVSDDVEGNAAFAEIIRLPPQYWQVVQQEQKPASLFGLAIRD